MSTNWMGCSFDGIMPSSGEGSIGGMRYRYNGSWQYLGSNGSNEIYQASGDVWAVIDSNWERNLGRNIIIQSISGNVQIKYI